MARDRPLRFLEVPERLGGGDDRERLPQPEPIQRRDSEVPLEQLLGRRAVAKAAALDAQRSRRPPQLAGARSPEGRLRDEELARPRPLQLVERRGKAHLRQRAQLSGRCVEQRDRGAVSLECDGGEAE